MDIVDKSNLLKTKQAELQSIREKIQIARNNKRDKDLLDIEKKINEAKKELQEINDISQKSEFFNDKNINEQGNKLSSVCADNNCPCANDKNTIDIFDSIIKNNVGYSIGFFKR